MEIDDVGATAFVIAAIRAMEQGRKRPLFHDPYSELFVDDRGRTVVEGLRKAFPPATDMVRIRTRFFSDLLRDALDAGTRQVVLLGGGLDMRAHLFRRPGVLFLEVDRQEVVDCKRQVLEAAGIETPATLARDYLEADVPEALGLAGLDLDEPALVLWEGNTMYLPPDAPARLLRRLGDRMASVRVAFDYFALDMQARESASEADVARLQRVEDALGVSFSCGFPDLGSLEESTPFSIEASGSFAALGERYGREDVARAYPKDHRATLELYRYCVLAKA